MLMLADLLLKNLRWQDLLLKRKLDMLRLVKTGFALAEGKRIQRVFLWERKDGLVCWAECASPPVRPPARLPHALTNKRINEETNKPTKTNHKTLSAFKCIGPALLFFLHFPFQ